jgi:hypothetical protein
MEGQFNAAGATMKPLLQLLADIEPQSIDKQNADPWRNLAQTGHFPTGERRGGDPLLEEFRRVA